MTRSYKQVHPNVNMAYSVEGVKELYGVSSNTVSNWVGEGLETSDGSIPYLIRGAELKGFHEERQQRTRTNLRYGEFKCLGCGHAVFPETDTVSVTNQEGRAPLANATCCDCGASLMKLLSATECDKILDCVGTNTRLDRIDERKVETPARIGKESTSQGGVWVTINDRIIYDWQAYARRYNPKTLQSHLVSIREFEMFSGGISFDKITPKHAGAYRDHLVRLANMPKEKGGLSKSTVRHRAAHLSQFFKWLRGQSGYRRLSASIPDYFALPRSATAKRTRMDPKTYLSLEDAWRMVDAMPVKTLVERRDRAMVAFSYVSGLRAGALTSVRVKHLDLEKRTVEQDATDMRAKNGKSYRANWFPRTESFQEVFIAWLEELKGLGFKTQDGVFPAAKDLKHPSSGMQSVEPLESSRPLQVAFTRASEAIGQRCTPHSARHTLKAVGARICRTQEERKAWSMNLGHDDDQITERHYGKMSQEQCDALIDVMHSEEAFTEEEKDMILDFHEKRFMRGTREYQAAQRLADKREKARGDYEVIE
ncbi:tyrosine-type recombinase/integrase [Shimia sagamensis]|uniref:Site-specific recombinase XerD n=1 Tax=Shimia sagamensis TaxID=1566352 RepID=A0ABY1PKT8_9RHOB|nr:site-specific integrase [Shimia sagamensis]SMP36241.1 Site-specific recombinase XerD [Shimia sagamensis]